MLRLSYHSAVQIAGPGKGDLLDGDIEQRLELKGVMDPVPQVAAGE